MTHRDLLVVGGGVIGLSIALEGARRGWKVGLIERGAIGRESSWAGAGILPAGATKPVDDPIEQLRQRSDVLHRQWASWLLELTGIDNEHRASGGIYLGRTAAERATLRANCIWWEELGIAYDRLQSADLFRVAPGIRCDSDFYLVPGDAKVRNPRHLEALSRGCQLTGVELFEHREVVSFETDASAIKSVKAKGCGKDCQYFSAERYCIASGAWASLLTKELGIETQVYPVRGQMLLYRLASPPFPMVINEGHRYIVPREDGHLVIGSCEEEVGFDRSTTDAMLLQLQGWAEEVMPELRTHDPVKQWAGLRPGSIDSYPYLGTLHPFSNGYLAGGHFRHGLHWSTASAELMIQHMRGEPTTISLEPFRVQRGNTLSF